MNVAVTIRADRCEPLQSAPELDPVHPLVFPNLKPLPPAGYIEVIRGPARRHHRPAVDVWWCIPSSLKTERLVL